MDAGQWFVIGLSAVLIAGYIGGYYYNRRQAERIFAWLHPALARWGEVRAGGRIAGLTTGGRLNVEQAREPFRRIEATAILEARENLLFWIFNRLRGKRDELTLVVNLRKAPDQEVEAARSPDRSFRQLIASSGKKSFEVLSTQHGFEIAHRGRKESRLASQVQGFLDQYGDAVIRFSMQSKQPHLTVRADLSKLQKASAEAFFASLGELTG